MKKCFSFRPQTPGMFYTGVLHPFLCKNILLYMHIYIYMGTSQNTRYGSRPRTHTRSIPPDPYLDPYPMILHDPYPWSIPLIHTPDPYPWSVPLSRWRKTDAGPNAAFYPNTASGPRTATPVATTVASTAASAASARCLRCLRAAAGAAAAAPTSHLPPRSCCYCCRFCCCSCWSCSRCWCWIPPCASGSWRQMQLVD